MAAHWLHAEPVNAELQVAHVGPEAPALHAHVPVLLRPSLHLPYTHVGQAEHELP